MKITFLDFEQPIAELEAKIDELHLPRTTQRWISQPKLHAFQKKSHSLTHGIYSKLTPWQIFQVAPASPASLYAGLYPASVHWFRRASWRPQFADDYAIIGGLARFNGQTVMVIGHQKGRDTKEKIHRNFGMPKPEGYRKALRLMRLAEKFSVPCSPLSIRPAHIPASVPRSAGNRRPSGKIFMFWRSSRCR